MVKFFFFLFIYLFLVISCIFYNNNKKMKLDSCWLISFSYAQYSLVIHKLTLDFFTLTLESRAIRTSHVIKGREIYM